MTFPLDYRSKIDWRKDVDTKSQGYITEFLGKMSDELKKVKGTDIMIQGNRVRFNGGLFRFVSNWNILVPITTGYIEVSPVNGRLIISYNLNFKQMLVMVSIFALLGLGLSVLASYPMRLLDGLTWAIIVWLFGFGMNFLITIYRFPKFIERVSKIS